MFGFLVGTLCLIGLIKVARHGHMFHGGCGRGYCGYGSYGPWSERGGWQGGSHGDWRDGVDWRQRGRHRGGRFFLRALFERLDTTPGQEKVIAQAFEELREKGRAAKSELRVARAEVAKAMRGASFDEVALGTATAQAETVIDSMRKASIDAFARVHEALDERQRNQLADFIEHGPNFRDFARGSGGNDGHPYRYSV